MKYSVNCSWLGMRRKKHTADNFDSAEDRQWNPNSWSFSLITINIKEQRSSTIGKASSPKSKSDVL